jgi:hypothetical protein
MDPIQDMQTEQIFVVLHKMRFIRGQMSILRLHLSIGGSNCIGQGLYIRPTYLHRTPEFHSCICPAQENIPEIRCFSAPCQKLTYNGQTFQ